MAKKNTRALGRPRSGSHQLLASFCDWIGGICGYLAGMVSSPQGPSGPSTVATEEGQLSCWKLCCLPTLRHGAIAGVFRKKGAAPWGTVRAESCNSVFLPNDLSLDDWHAGFYALPTVWSEASMLGADYLRKVAGYDFHLLRRSMMSREHA